MPLSMRIVRNQSGQIRKLQDKVEKLKEKLKATERAQSTEENRSGGQLVAVRHRSVIAELDAVFYQRLTFRKDAWRAGLPAYRKAGKLRLPRGRHQTSVQGV